MRNDHTRFDHNYSVTECGYHLDLDPWDDTVGDTGEALSYFDPNSPLSSFAPDTLPGVGIVTSHMPLTLQGPCFGISGDDPGENEQYSSSIHNNEENPTVNPSHLDMSQYQAMYATGTQASDSYINTQACSYPPFFGVGPSGPLPTIQHSPSYSFAQSVEAYQASDIPLTRDQNSNQYNSAAVAGAYPPHCYAPSE